MFENVQENKEPQSTDPAGFTPISSQEELDRIIGNRLALRYLPGCFPAPKSSHRRPGVARPAEEIHSGIKGPQTVGEESELPQDCHSEESRLKIPENTRFCGYSSRSTFKPRVHSRTRGFQFNVAPSKCARPWHGLKWDKAQVSHAENMCRKPCAESHVHVSE